MSFLKLRELMALGYKPQNERSYIDAIESIENREEQLLACEYFTAHGFLIKTILGKSLNLPIFRELYISNNKIKSLEKAVFPDCVNILYLRYNQIQTLEGVVFPDSLGKLYLSSNQIKTLEGAVFPDSLKFLYLLNNQIKTLEGAAIPEGCRVIL